eukprot:jgi/Tetstr1/441278/TSEL_029529.t1
MKTPSFLRQRGARAAASKALIPAASITTTQIETLKDGSAEEVFTLDLSGPKPITQTVVRPPGAELIALEVMREGGMGMVLEEAMQQTDEAAAASSRVTVVESRMSGQKRRDNSRVPAALPEGLCTVVAEVAPGSNAEKAGVKVGDKIRFFSAVFTVTDPVDIVSFYANPPKKENRRGVYMADGQPFDKTMAALISNGEPHVTAKEGAYDVAESVLMVVERRVE